MKTRFKDIMNFIKGTNDEHMGAFAAQSAFFIFLSFFPIINIIIAIPKFLPLTEAQVLDLIYYVLPGNFESYVADIVAEMYQNSTGSMTIISIIITLWSAAKGLMAVRNGLNEVYRSREQRNYIIIRGISAIYTVAFVIILLALTVLNMFGTQIAMFVFNKFPQYQNEAWLVMSIKGGASFILLFLMFELLYTIVPNRKLKFRNQIPGAIFAAFAWIVVTKVFSLYIDLFASKSYMYGSLTTVVMLMFWMYFVISLIFVGAQINEYLQTCRDREEQYELSKYGKDATEVWDDDEMLSKEDEDKKESDSEDSETKKTDTEDNDVNNDNSDEVLSDKVVSIFNKRKAE